MANPLYNTACTPRLTILPPLTFQGMTQRIFPLQADLFILRQFCDQYINVAPEVTRFEPFAPFVYLLVVNYGKLASAAANLGWISQYEITFSIPLLRYDVRQGRRELVDVVYMTPFIYVDNPLSLTTGRQVYGWPKVLAQFDPGINPWLNDPRSPQFLMSLSAQALPPRGGRQEQRPLIEILNLETYGNALLPTSLKPLLSAVTALPKALLGSLTLAQDLAAIWAAPPFLGYGEEARPLLAEAMVRGFRDVLPLPRNPIFQIITLKQFRDAVVPQDACYQALVQTPMQLGRFNAGGLLGELAKGDPSGGFRIKIHRYPSQPVVSYLGLKVEDTVVVDGNFVDVLRPFYPYWLDVDLNYGSGKVICWRTGEDWKVGRDLRVRPAPQPAAMGTFNTALGPAAEEYAGPFQFSDASVRVLALPADPSRLAAFVRQYLSVPPEIGVFEADGNDAHVYLFVTSCDRISSKSEPLGFLQSISATFHVPVVWRENGCEEVRGLAVAYAFVTDPTVATVAQEVEGLPVIQAKVESPPDLWLKAQAFRTVLAVRTQIFPALNLGAEAQERLLFAVTEGLLEPGELPWKADVPSVPAPREDQERSAEDLHRQPPFHRRSLFTLKQFRDSENPQEACFQQILRFDQPLKISDSLLEATDNLNVWIFNYPYIPIVENLGLKVGTVGSNLPGVDAGGVQFDIFKVEGSYSFHTSVLTVKPYSICWRAGSKGWEKGEPPRQPSFVGSKPPKAKRSPIPTPGKAPLEALAQRGEGSPDPGGQEGGSGGSGKKPSARSARGSKSTRNT